MRPYLKENKTTATMKTRIGILVHAYNPIILEPGRQGRECHEFHASLRYTAARQQDCLRAGAMTQRIQT